MFNEDFLFKKTSELLKKVSFDFVSVGFIDFNKNHFKEMHFFKNSNGLVQSLKEVLIYDLASISKILTMGIANINLLHNSNWDESKIDIKLKLTSEHQSSMPAWGYLNKSTWKKDLLSYQINKANELYSDYGALRFLLEYNLNSNLYQDVKAYWDKEIFNWIKVNEIKDAIYVPNGFGQFRVHDPNAFNLGEFCSHAGMFGSVQGLIKTFLLLEEKFNLCDNFLRYLKINKKEDKRFYFGFDTKSKNSKLIDEVLSDYTFGHLGFTGTSIWIDPVKKIGQVILSNAVKNYWYEKEELNQFRKEISAILV